MQCTGNGYPKMGQEINIVDKYTVGDTALPANTRIAIGDKCFSSEWRINYLTMTLDKAVASTDIKTEVQRIADNQVVLDSLYTEKAGAIVPNVAHIIIPSLSSTEGATTLFQHDIRLQNIKQIIENLKDGTTAPTIPTSPAKVTVENGGLDDRYYLCVYSTIDIPAGTNIFFNLSVSSPHIV